MNLSDTIFALSTGSGKAAIAIVRVSGPQSANILKSICKREHIASRRAVHSCLYDSSGRLIDRGIVLFFDQPRSFTGEDMIEFQVTGGRGVTSTLLRNLQEFPRTRPAGAGEFARRAFENGKIDLVQVEGLAAIIDSETQAEVRHSALMAHGKLSEACERARTELLHAASLLEGFLDFSDVEDPVSQSMSSVFAHLRAAKSILSLLINTARVAERLRSGFTVAIVGKPNAGKSTLINNLLSRDAALVSEIPGTTRDYLEFFVELDGFPIVFVDTAGFREASEPIERMGIEKSMARVRTADLLVWLDESEHVSPDFLPKGVPVIEVISKIDLAPGRESKRRTISISARTGEGIDVLFRHITAMAESFFENHSEVGLGSERQIGVVSEAISAIERAIGLAKSPEELIAEEVRVALVAVGRITGRVDVEDLLDQVFARLCVGK